MKLSDSLYREKLPFNEPLEKIQARFIFLSTLEGKMVSKLMYLILFVSYAQIFFQTTQIARNYFPQDHEEQLPLLQTLEDAFTVETLFAYNQYDELLLISCCCIVVYVSLLIITFLVTVYDAVKSIQSSFLGAKIWPLMVQVHCLIFFFPINNLCNRLQVESWNGELRMFSAEGDNRIVFYFSIIICLINLFFAAVPYILLLHVLPGNYSLASKSFMIDQITLFEKIFVTILVKFLPDSTVVGWILMLLVAVLSSMRLFWYLFTLPRYNFVTLALELYLINLCLLSSLLAVVTFGLNQIFNSNIHMGSFAIVLLVLGPLDLVYSNVLFRQTIKKIILFPYEKLNAYKALHKVLTLKYLERQMKNPNRRTEYIDTYYFYFSTIRSSIQNILGGKDDPYVDVDLTAKEQQNNVKRKYLENLAIIHGKYDEFKLVLARFYVRNLKLYILAVKTLTRVKSRSFKIQASVKLLQLQIQQQMLKEAKMSDNGLNLEQYFTSIDQKKSFKEEIARQLNYQNEFWKEFSKDKPEVLKLQNLSELIHFQKHKIAKKWNQLEKKFTLGINYLYSLYGCYQYLLNDSPSRGREYMKKFNLFNERYSQQELITNSNLFDQNNFSITIRTHQDSTGIISDCSNNIKKILKYEKEDLIGANIGNMMSPYIAERHNSFIQEYIKTGYSIFLGQFRIEFLKNRLGYLQKVSLWTNIHPFIDQEVRLTGLFRMIYDSKEYIFLTPQGDIDSFTAKIAFKLGIQEKKINIRSICPNFAQICEDHALVPFHQDHENLKLTSAEEITFSIRPLILQSENSKVFLQKSVSYQQNQLKVKDNLTDCILEFKTYPNGPKSQTYGYQCHLKTITFKDTFLTAIEVDMVEKDKESNLRVKNMQRKLTNAIEKYRNSQQQQAAEEEEHSDDYNTGQGELPNELNVPTTQIQKNQTDNYLISTLQTKPEMTSQNLIELRRPSVPLSFMARKSENSKIKKKKDFENKQNTEKRGNVDKIDWMHQGVENSVSGSSVSRKDKRQTHVEDIFEAKYYPKQLVFILVLIAGIFLTTLILELYLQIRTNKDLQVSNALTTTLILATQRADTFTAIGRGARGAYFALSGLIPKGTASNKNFLANAANTFRTNSPILKNYNAQLQQAIQDVDEVFQEKFKAENTKMYDVNPDLTSGPYQLFNTFTAINVLVEKVLKAASYHSQKGDYTFQDLYYILINCVNDLLVGTGEAVTLILDNTHLSFQDNTKMVKFCQIFLMSLLSIEVFLVILLILNAYNYELKLISQFMGLSSESLQLIRNRLDYFDKVIQNESFDQLSEVDLNAPMFYEKKINVYAKKQAVKMEKLLQKKTLQHLYLKKLLLFILILFGYITAIYFATQETSDKVETLRLKVNALAKTQTHLTETAILAFTLAQILCGDLVLSVRNRPPEVEFKLDLKNFLQGGYDLLEAFTEKDGSYDPIIAPFFFENSCKFISPNSSSKSVCLTIAKESNNFALFTLFTRHHSLMSNTYQEFVSSNKSFSVLSGLVNFNINNIVPSTALIRELLQAMVAQIQTNLNGIWDMTNKNINIVLSVCTIFLAIIGLMTWSFTLRHFIECSNRFKRMMRIIPFNILIRNPALKGTLMITSRGKLHKLKNEL